MDEGGFDRAFLKRTDSDDYMTTLMKQNRIHEETFKTSSC